MKVMFVSYWFPYPPDNGARIRAYNLIGALAREHEVYLVSLLQGDSERENATLLNDICKVVSLHDSRWFRSGTLKAALGYFSTRPRSFVDTFDPAIEQAVYEAVGRVKPDVVIASTIGVAEYVPTNLGIPTILEEHNCEYAVLKRAAEGSKWGPNSLLAQVRWRKFARWEAGVCRRYSAVSMVSKNDRELLQAVAQLDNVYVVPNGVDTGHYTPSERNPDKHSLIYNGAPTYSANLDAVRFFAGDVYPLLTKSFPDVKLRVTGRTDVVNMGELADCPGVEFTGYVDDIRIELNRAAACVVTLRQGGGSRLKILEAMAAGVPVVSTSVGIEGIEATNGRHAMIADTPEELAAAIREVLEDGELQASLSQEARRLVEEQYSWSVIGGDFVKIVEDVSAAGSARQGEVVERY